MMHAPPIIVRELIFRYRHDFKYQVPKVANRAECLDETCVERYELLASRWLWRRGLLNISCSFGATLRTYFLPLLAWTSPVIEHIRVHKIVICSRLPWTLDTRWIWTVDETDEYIHDQLRFDFFPHLKGTFLQPFLPLFNWAAIDVSALLMLLMLLVSGSVKGLKQWL